MTRYFGPSAKSPLRVTVSPSTSTLNLSGTGATEIQRETVSTETSSASGFENWTIMRRPATRLLSAAMLEIAKGFTVPITISFRAGSVAFHSAAGMPASTINFQSLPGGSGFVAATKTTFFRSGRGLSLSFSVSSSDSAGAGFSPQAERFRSSLW